MTDHGLTPAPLVDAGTGQPWPADTSERVGGARHYTGPERDVVAPWKCPACLVENLGRLELGCVHCGAGKPGVHVGVDAPAAVVPAPAPEYSSGRNEASADDFDYWYARSRDRINAGTWTQPQLEDLCRSAFDAGWRAHQRIVLQAPPVMSDVRALAPAGKPTRTIIAALDLFKDQVLRHQPEEVASGEWCSAEEVDALLVQLHAQADDA